MSLKELEYQCSESEIEIDKNDLINKYLSLAEKAEKEYNYEEVEKYSDLILQLNPENIEGWILKGISAGWQSTLKKNRFSEVLACFTNALQYANDIYSEEIIITEVKDILKAIIKLYIDNFAQSPEKELKKELKDAISDIYFILGLFIEKNNLMIGITDIKQFISLEINKAVVYANDIMIADFGPEKRNMSDYALEKLIERTDACTELLEYALINENDDYYNFQIYQNLIFLQDRVINLHAYQYNPVISGYVKSGSLDEGSKIERMIKINEWKRKAKEIDPDEREKREEEKVKRERFKKYWEENTEKKQNLERELVVLQERLKSARKGFFGMMSKEQKKINSQIEEIKRELTMER